MKHIISVVILSILFFLNSYAQFNYDSLPPASSVTPYKLDIGFNTTTLIVFPVPLVPAADRGSKDIIIQQEKTISNVLKIKADKKDFSPTNLHIYTIDGKLYVFSLNYKEYPAHTTYDLAKLSIPQDIPTSLIVNENLRNGLNIKEMAMQARYSSAFFSKKKTRYDMQFRLRTIHTFNDWMIIGFGASNRSSLDYDVDFIRMYIRDKRQIKRSSIQEQEIIPVYKEKLFTIPGGKESRFVIVVPKFTIPDKKKFVIEMFEKNGGRNITLEVKNKHLLRSKVMGDSL